MRLSLLVPTALLVSACSNVAMRLDPVSENGAVVRTTYSAGKTKKLAESRKTETWVSVERTENQSIAKYGVPLTISLFNGSVDSIAFGPTSIRATEGNRPLVLLDEKGIQEARESEQRVMLFLTLLNAAAAGYARGRAQTTDPYAAQRYTSMASMHSNNVALGLTSMEQSSAQAAALANEYSKVALTPESVAPLKTHGGFLIVKDYGGREPLIVTVEAGSERHVFSFVAKQ